MFQTHRTVHTDHECVGVVVVQVAIATSAGGLALTKQNLLVDNRRSYLPTGTIVDPKNFQ